MTFFTVRVESKKTSLTFDRISEEALLMSLSIEECHGGRLFKPVFFVKDEVAEGVKSDAVR